MSVHKFHKYFQWSLLIIILCLNTAYGRNDQMNRLNNVIIDYDAYVSEFLAETKVPGTAIAIVDDGEIIFLKCYGVQKVGENRPVDANTTFRISSVSKGFAV